MGTSLWLWASQTYFPRRELREIYLRTLNFQVIICEGAVLLARLWHVNVTQLVSKYNKSRPQALLFYNSWILSITSWCLSSPSIQDTREGYMKNLESSRSTNYQIFDAVQALTSAGLGSRFCFNALQATKTFTYLLIKRAGCFGCSDAIINIFPSSQNDPAIDKQTASPRSRDSQMYLPGRASVN